MDLTNFIQNASNPQRSALILPRGFRSGLYLAPFPASELLMELYHSGGIWIEPMGRASFIVVNDPVVSAVRFMRIERDGSSTKRPCQADAPKVLFEIANFGSDRLTTQRNLALMKQLRKKGVTVTQYTRGDVRGLRMVGNPDLAAAMTALGWPPNVKSQITAMAEKVWQVGHQRGITGSVYSL